MITDQAANAAGAVGEHRHNLLDVLGAWKVGRENEANLSPATRGAAGSGHDGLVGRNSVTDFGHRLSDSVGAPSQQFQLSL